MEKPVTVIISDLHMGAGPNDPGDDHIFQGNPLQRLIAKLAKSKHGRRGDIELFINGDLFEFAQVRPDLFQGGHYYSWASESESKQRLEIILDGHKAAFAAMSDFLVLKNGITMAAGNHDVDLYWEDVQERLQQLGPIEFALGETWYSRYEGRLQISHGHMEDPANKFERWKDPILRPDHAEPRLEMCPGTLFMLKFVNVLEKDYPFVDNIKPVTALSRLLWGEKKREFSAVAWLFTKFVLAHPGAALGVRDPGDFHGMLKRRWETSTELRGELRAIAERTYRRTMSDAEVGALFATEEKLFGFMMDVLREGGLEDLSRFDASGGGDLTAGGADGTLAIARAGAMKESEHLRTVATERFVDEKNCQVIVMGHTHQPDHSIQSGRHYYNPGSWTRYADTTRYENLTLEKLKNEFIYPYELNYVWVQNTGDKVLRSEMKNFERNLGE